jgi:hypothetical protein
MVERLLVVPPKYLCFFTHSSRVNFSFLIFYQSLWTLSIRKPNVPRTITNIHALAVDTIPRTKNRVKYFLGASLALVSASQTIVGESSRSWKNSSDRDASDQWITRNVSQIFMTSILQDSTCKKHVKHLM